MKSFKALSKQNKILFKIYDINEHDLMQLLNLLRNDYINLATPYN